MAKGKGSLITVTAADAAIVKARKEGKVRWLTESRGRGHGALVLKAQPNGSGWWYLRHSDKAGRQRHYPVGKYAWCERATPEGADPVRGASIGVADAREIVNELIVRLKATPDRDLHASDEREAAQARAELEAKTQDEARRREEAEHAARFTLRALVDHYVAALERKGKTTTAKDVKRLVKLHVIDAFPAVANKVASTVESSEITEVLRKLSEAGKERTAGKLRSYLLAAYGLALGAETDHLAPSALIPFKIKANPVAPTKAGKIRALDRNLTDAELRAFLTRADTLPELHRDALRLALLLGGQRPTQLLRVEVRDVADGTIVLRDPKGRRAEPRLHVLPLQGEASEIVSRLLERARRFDSRWLLSTQGKKALRVETISGDVAEIARKMVAAREAREPFQLRDLRRTCETMLSRLGISRDLRAQLLSHGLGGVQARHYDRHAYMDEKRAALHAWEAEIVRIAKGAKASNVTEISEHRAAKGAA